MGGVAVVLLVILQMPVLLDGYYHTTSFLPISAEASGRRAVHSDPAFIVWSITFES